MKIIVFFINKDIKNKQKKETKKSFKSHTKQYRKYVTVKQRKWLYLDVYLSLNALKVSYSK